MNENMKKMDDPHFKNVIIFILFIFILFFISNDKNFNKIFQKNIVKILFIITLVYMAYLKVNICIILGVFFLFILFNTNIGKKLQKNKYIKKIIKLFSPYIQPIIYAIEDLVASFTNLTDDDSSVGSIVSASKANRKVHFEDDNDLDEMDLDEIDDLEFNHQNETKLDNNNNNYDILDEIRNDMNLSMPSGPSGPSGPQDDIKNNIEYEDEDQEDENDDITPDATLDHNEVKKLYQELASVKTQLNNIDD